MHKVGLLVAAAILVTAAGCGSPGVGRERSPRIGASSAKPVELKFTSNPPVRSRLKVTDAEIYGWSKVHYIPYDLNGDGKPEYFILDQPHARKGTYILMDSAGECMLRKSLKEQAESVDEAADWATHAGYFCCDQVLILENKHEGYFDFIAIDTEWDRTPEQLWTLWVRKGGRYEAQSFHNELCFYTHDRKGPAPYIGVVGTDDGSHDFASPRIRAYWSDAANSR